MALIRHTVAFALPFTAGSDEERTFLGFARRLAAIDVVEGFTVLRSVDPEAALPLMLSMEFSDAAAYDAYNAHPTHRSFVEQFWAPTVVAFHEADFTIERTHQEAASA